MVEKTKSLQPAPPPRTNSVFKGLSSDSAARKRRFHSETGGLNVNTPGSYHRSPTRLHSRTFLVHVLPASTCRKSIQYLMIRTQMTAYPHDYAIRGYSQINNVEFNYKITSKCRIKFMKVLFCFRGLKLKTFSN